MTTDNFSEIKKFLENENVKCDVDEAYKDTLRFRSYGRQYSIRRNGEGFEFCCKFYQDVKLLIDAINNECRGHDSKL